MTLTLIASLIGAAACASAGADESYDGASQNSGGASRNYLPLEVGRKWVLQSPKYPENPVVFEVLAREGEAYRLRFDNPWLKSELLMLPKDGKYFLTEVTINGQKADVPDDTLYWDLSSAPQKSWSNDIGRMSVVSRDKSVKIGDQTYPNCIQIREKAKAGNENLWTFAPGVGFVQFGESDWAFVLTGAPEPASDSRPDTAAAPAATRNRRADLTGNAYVGLSANPFANESFNAEAVNARFEQAVSSGVSFIYQSAKWEELEPQPRKYKFDVSDNVDEFVKRAGRHNLPVAYNLRIVDTNQKPMPGDLKNKSFNDPQVRERLFGLLDALIPRFRKQVKFLMLGNEIDNYFRDKKEVAAFNELFVAAAQKVKQLDPEIRVSTTVTFPGLSKAESLLKPLLDNSDFFALTYYPLKPDTSFEVRDPDSVKGDFERILSAANGKKILLQEVGYPSSARNKSSEEKQAQLFSNVFDFVESRRGEFIGVNFFLMSDLPDWMVEGFAKYYKADNSDAFKSFLQTLGMYDGQGRPKKSMEVFKNRAPRLGTK